MTMPRTKRTVLMTTSIVALLVTAGQAWVEAGKAPETLLATRRDQAGAVTRSRLLCAYPLVAKYAGRGSTDDAANFECGTGF
jgi:hypothetical protein